MSDYRLPGDTEVFSWVNGLNSPMLDGLFVVVSSHWFGLSALALCAAFIVERFRRKALLPLASVALGIGLADAIGFQLLKPWFGRTRPSFALPADAVRVLSPAADVGSMPSLHAANAFALAMVVGHFIPKSRHILFPLAAVVSLSRIGVGVHWPSDIIVGALWGTLMGFAAWTIVERIAKTSNAARSPER